MIVGFTGAREGMTFKQIKALIRLLRTLDLNEAHHGGCVGADEQFHKIICKLFNQAWTVNHPCDIKKYRANIIADVRYTSIPALARNKMIVDQSDILIACPKTKEEELRSGTWSTVRYARKIGKPVKIVEP